MGEVVPLETDYYGDIPPNDILSSALNEGLSEVLVIGFTEKDDFYMAASAADLARHLVLIELARDVIMERLKE